MKTRKSGRRPVDSDPPPPTLGARYEITDDRPRRVAEQSPAYGDAPSTSVVSATEAARRFSDLINRACFQEETFVIERGGRPICQLGPLQGRSCSGADLLALLTRLPRPDEDFLAAVEAVNRSQAVVEGSPWEK
jgi:antitoxin (DNA-binding transcriptional repressor) of toxin-antitoxin stability system